MVSQVFRQFRPLLNKVLLQQLKPNAKTKCGLFLPDSVRGSPNLAKVIAVGQGRINSHGVRIPPLVKEGDVVVLPGHGGTQVRVEEEDYVILHDDDLLGVVES